MADDVAGPARPSGDRQGGAGRLERRRHHRPRHRDAPSRAAEQAVRLRRQLHGRRRQGDVADTPTFNAYIARAGKDYARCRRRPTEFDAFVAQISRDVGDPAELHQATQLRAITVPTVIVDGDHDEAIEPAHTAEMAKLIPGREARDPEGRQPLRHVAEPRRVQRHRAGLPRRQVARRLGQPRVRLRVAAVPYAAPSCRPRARPGD